MGYCPACILASHTAVHTCTNPGTLTTITTASGVRRRTPKKRTASGDYLTDPISISVHATQVTQGSTKIRGGKITHDKAGELAVYRSAIRTALHTTTNGRTYPPDTALIMQTVFELPHGSKEAAHRELPTHELDLDKLTRAVGDAISTPNAHDVGVIGSDARIVAWLVAKTYGPVPLTHITITPIPGGVTGETLAALITAPVNLDNTPPRENVGGSSA